MAKKNSEISGSVNIFAINCSVRKRTSLNLQEIPFQFEIDAKVKIAHVENELLWKSGNKRSKQNEFIQIYVDYAQFC